jgi:hypothetical protein
MLTETAIPKGKLTVNAQLLRDLIRSRVKLDQIQLRAFRRDVLPILRSMESEIMDALESAGPSDRALGDLRRSQYESILRDVRSVIENATKEIPPSLEQAVTDAASREVRTTYGAITRAVPELKVVMARGIPAESLAAITKATTKEVLQPFAKNWGTKALGRVHDELSKAVGLGEDMREAAIRVQSVLPATRKQALVIARTGIQKAAALGAEEFREQPENKELLKGVQWVATLDTRTCAVCGGFDGKWWSFKRDDTAEGLYSQRPELPAHAACRCVYVDVLKSGDEVGLPGLNFSPGTRASMDGGVPDSVTFPDWLKSQPVNIQKSVLGPARWELWKSGSADFEDFSYAGRMRTIDELGDVL